MVTVPPSGPIRSHAFRLHPGDDLMPSLRNNVDVILARLNQSRFSSAFILTAVGSVSDVTLRLANASRRDTGENVESPDKSSDSALVDCNNHDCRCGLTSRRNDGTNDIKRWAKQRFELVSLVGTFSRDGGCHLHASLSDASGITIGGHLVAATVFTTLEVVIGTIDGVEFTRVDDDETGYRELVPVQLPPLEEGTLSSWRTAIVFLLAGFALGLSVQKKSS